MVFHFDPQRTFIGSVFTHAGEEDLALSELDRMNHLLVIGKTGMGKTRLLKNIIVQDIHSGRGIGVIDPHGDLQDELLDEIPRSRSRDLVYLDPNDPKRVVTFNVVANVPRDRIAPTTSEIVAAFKAVWDSWGPRMERILYNAVAALIEAENTSLIGLPCILKDERYRASVLAQVKDPIVHGFFAEEYATWDDDFRTTAIDPVLNKVEALLAAPVVRAILGSTKSSIDFSEIMDKGKIIWDDKLPGFCVRCQGRAKAFGLQVRVLGKQRWLTVGKWGVLTLEEARQQARVLLGRLAAGEDLVQRRERIKGLPTIDILADHFIREHVRPKLKPRTAAEYIRLLNTAICTPQPATTRVDRRGRPSRKRASRPRLGHIRVDALTTADVVRFHNALSEVPYEANRALAVLSGLMAFAEQHALRPPGSNPCKGVAKFKEHRRERFLTPSEFGKLATILDEVERSGHISPFTIAAFRLLILTGARREEVRTLQWSDVDVERGLAVLADSKTGRKVIHLSPPALRLLAGLPRLAGNPYVFAGGRTSELGGVGGGGLPIRDLQGPWEDIRARAGLPHLRLHDLRHSYASLLAASGTPLLAIGKLLGHRHVATTARYAHLADDPLRLANDRIGDQLADTLQIGTVRKRDA